MAKKPTSQSSASRRPPKPPKKTGIGLEPGAGGGRFSSFQPTKQGAIASYVHAGARIGVMVELSCNSDFVARTDDFLNLAKELCLQIAATKPRWLKRDEVPPEVLQEKRKELESYLSDACLLEQVYIREPSGRMKVKNLLTDVRAKLGENIQVRRFIRWEIGVD